MLLPARYFLHEQAALRGQRFRRSHEGAGAREELEANRADAERGAEHHRASKAMPVTASGSFFYFFEPIQVGSSH
jgi:hypothetical protein